MGFLIRNNFNKLRKLTRKKADSINQDGSNDAGRQAPVRIKPVKHKTGILTSSPSETIVLCKATSSVNPRIRSEIGTKMIYLILALTF